MDLSNLYNSQDSNSVLILKQWREEQRKRLLTLAFLLKIRIIKLLLILHMWLQC